MMDPHMMQGKIMEIITALGDMGVFIGMFLESSIVPVPSEVIVVGAAAIGIPMASIVIFGSLGATAGALVGYALGRYAAMPAILKYGKYILIKPHQIYKAEAFASKYGPFSVFIGRIIPIVPFKVFSIAAGITRIPLGAFVIYTLLGVIPRMYILSIFGTSLVKYTKPSLLILAGIILIFIAYKLSRKFYTKNNSRRSKS